MTPHNQTSATPAPAADATLWVEEYRDYLFLFALGHVGDPSAAEDLVQETYLAALRSLDRFAGNSSERTWLTGILRHKICDHLRHCCRRRTVPLNTAGEGEGDDELMESLLWLEDLSMERASPTRQMELAEFHAALDAALGRLPERAGQVFRLYEIDEVPSREICETMQISESNLWVMMHRARRQLREQLGDWWNVEALRS